MLRPSGCGQGDTTLVCCCARYTECTRLRSSPHPVSPRSLHLDAGRQPARRFSSGVRADPDSTTLTKRRAWKGGRQGRTILAALSVLSPRAGGAHAKDTVLPERRLYYETASRRNYRVLQDTDLSTSDFRQHQVGLHLTLSICHQNLSRPRHSDW